MTAAASPVRAPAPVLFVLGGVSMYVGAAIAVGLFDRLAPTAVAVLRMLGAARGAAGLATAGPRGLAGPPAAAGGGVRVGHGGDEHRVLRGHRPAAAGHRGGHRVLRPGGGRGGGLAPSARHRRRSCWPRSGWLLIADVRWSGSPSGVLWALAAAALWAAYIVLGKRVASAGNGLDDMAVGFAVAAVVLSPLLLLGGARPGWRRWPTRSCCCSRSGSACCPAWCPTCSTRSCCAGSGRRRFAVLLALLPATATLVGLIALGQVPSPLEAVGIAPSWRRSRCGRGTATPPSRWADRADDHRCVPVAAAYPA